MACQIKGCSRKVRTRGFCNKHYAEYWFRKNNEMVRPKKLTFIQLELPLAL